MTTSAQSYAAYTDSPHWKALRAEAVEKWGGHCQCCGGDAGITVHHLTYARGWHNTQVDDLMPLCEHHHQRVHAEKRLDWMLGDKRVESWVKRKMVLAYLRTWRVLTVEEAEESAEEPMAKVYSRRKKRRGGGLSKPKAQRVKKDPVKEQARRVWSAGRIDAREAAARAFGWLKKK